MRYPDGTVIHEKPISYYVGRLREGKRFAFPGYSDAEWICIAGMREGGKSGLGQIFSRTHGKLLLEILKRRSSDKDFLFAVPSCIWNGSMPGLTQIRERAREVMNKHEVEVEFYERDMVTDDLARKGGLYPLINQLQQMRTVVIGPKALRGIDYFLKYDHFVEISTPNLHMEPLGIISAVEDALLYGKSATYLVSAGVSAAVILDRLYDEIPDSFFLDCGSMWDAFVGIGGQREWRNKLYENHDNMRKWRRANLYGK